MDEKREVEDQLYGLVLVDTSSDQSYMSCIFTNKAGVIWMGYVVICTKPV